jgi:hypothetical protein
VLLLCRAATAGLVADLGVLLGLVLLLKILSPAGGGEGINILVVEDGIF